MIHISQQICRSLREAHALGIIHRDLKPANVILLRQQDDHDFVKVLDFGLVKFFQGDNPEGEITNAGTFMGSPHYIAPEQARNQSPDQRCDIYSLGVLMYHMVTGRVPFTAPNPVDIILKHLHEPPVPPRQQRPDLNIDPNLEAIVLKSMAKDREQRYQSMDELLAALKIARTQITGVAGPMSIPPPAAVTGEGMPAIPLSALAANTPSSPMPSMRTPSGPMPTPPQVRGMPPPPPPDADISRPRSMPPPQVSEPPSFGRITARSSPVKVVVPAVVVAGLIGVVYWWATRPQYVTPAQVILTPDAIDKALEAKPPEPVTIKPTVPATYETVNVGTTLVTVNSTPGGAEVRDADDRLLGVTPYDLRAPTGKRLQLTVHRDGFKVARIDRTISGDRMPLTVSLKREPQQRADPAEPKRATPGYKKNPYE